MIDAHVCALRLHPPGRLKQPMPTPLPRRDRIFISYRRADAAGYAGRLEEDLTRLLGDRVFMDMSDIAAGTDFEVKLQHELASCGAVLALIGPRWRDALDAPRDGPDYVRLELGRALADAAVHVLPVLVQGANLPAAAPLPAELRPLVKRQALVLRDDRWNDDVANLARQLRAVLGLRHRPGRWIVAGAAALAVSAAAVAWYAQSRPPAPAAFSRPRAHDITTAAALEAARACEPAAVEPGECPLVFQFGPDGAARNVYFASGSCRLKAPPFGECVLGKLAAVRIAPFDNVDVAEVELNVAVRAGGAVKVTAEQ
jgi:hypothetical protein